MAAASERLQRRSAMTEGSPKSFEEYAEVAEVIDDVAQKYSAEEVRVERIAKYISVSIIAFGVLEA